MTMWYNKKGDEQDIAVSTRVRLARNLRDTPFPARMDEKQAEETVNRIASALLDSQAGFKRIDFDRLDRLTAESYVERHLASPDFINLSGPRALMLSEDESVSVMIREEDCVRLQVLGGGLCLDECFEAAKKTDRLLDEKLGFAFDRELGYLTACPTNLGCAVRFSVMLHLPALAETGNIVGLSSPIAKLGLTLRGMYGEGSSPVSAMYQISNALSLGHTEEELKLRLKDAVQRIIKLERDLRERIAKKDPSAYSDRVWRAYGSLKNARILSAAEAMQKISELRMAYSCGLSDVPSVEPQLLGELLAQIQPAGVALTLDNDRSARSRYVRRAEIVRAALA